MDAFLAIAYSMFALIGMVYAAQLIVGIFNWPARHNNPVYRFLGFLTSPVTKVVRAITPAQIADRHVPVVAVFLLFWLCIAIFFGRLYLRRPELFQ
jgi:uncharacterized protein YggT (Ycf19 family)